MVGRRRHAAAGVGACRGTRTGCTWRGRSSWHGSASIRPRRIRPSAACWFATGRSSGEGYHRRTGGPHAEVEALAAAGAAARGATAYVTLEPCAHFGRTPPCTRALLDAGIARVVYAMRDPDPRVAGHGHEELAAAGVAIESGPLGGRGGGTQPRLRAAHDARPAVGDAQDRHEPRRTHGACVRRQPVDHGGVLARGCPAPAGARIGDHDRHRHGAGGRSGAHGARSQARAAWPPAAARRARRAAAHPGDGACAGRVRPDHRLHRA